MRIAPIYQTREQLVTVLRDMTDRVEQGDSFEGYVEYLLPDPGDPPDGFRVKGSYRIGNLQGQGGMRITGRFE